MSQGKKKARTFGKPRASQLWSSLDSIPKLSPSPLTSFWPCDMSLYPAAEPLAAIPHTHDLTSPDASQLEVHERAEQGIRLARSHLESPPDSQIKTPSNDLGAGALLPQPSPQDAVDQSQAAACVTSDTQDIKAVQLCAWPT